MVLISRPYPFQDDHSCQNKVQGRSSKMLDPWPTLFDTWSMIHDPWSLILDPWSMIHDPWSMIHDPWSLILHPWWEASAPRMSLWSGLVRSGRSGPVWSSRSGPVRSVRSGRACFWWLAGGWLFSADVCYSSLFFCVFALPASIPPPKKVEIKNNNKCNLAINDHLLRPKKSSLPQWKSA